MKAKGKRQKAKEKAEATKLGSPSVLAFFCLLPFAFCLLLSSAAAQKRPKPALKEKEARAVVASAPGFKLNAGAVKVKEVSPAGASPVSVTADVTEAVRLAWVEDGRGAQDAGVSKKKRWRTVEFRTGDRTWEVFDYLAAPLGAERLESARAALEELVTEYAARLGQNKDESAADESGGAGQAKDNKTGGADDKKKGAGKGNKGESKNDEKKKVEPLTRGPLTIKGLSMMGSSSVAEVSVEATFRLAQNESGKWVVTEVSFGGEPVEDSAALWRAVNSQKAERARADLAVMRDALEAFRRERGFYVVAADSGVLMDHLSPRYVKQIVRLDPWHNPYRYNGTTDAYALASDGPDGKPGTADDVTLSR